ncbi:MAG TPA: ATP-binding protein [Pseudonocardiaceae bacterium]
MNASTVPGFEPGDRIYDPPRTPEPRRPPADHNTAGCAHHNRLLGVRRDLHDKVGSALTGMIVTVEVVERLIGMDTARAHRALADLRTDMADLLGEVRRLVVGRDDTHTGRGATTALRTMLGRMSRVVVDRLTITSDIDPLVDTVPETVAWAAFWIVREAMTNVLKHSRARHCAVSLSVRDGHLVARVEDDGTGIPAPRPTGSGLANMLWRAEEQGGCCTVTSAGRGGVVVVAWLPVDRKLLSLPGREAS